jgi:GNAT superfamily N-acetyltransferase
MTSLAAGEGEQLADGTGPNTPAGDNLVLDFVRGEAASYAALAQAIGGRVRRDVETGLSLSDMGLATPFGNTAHLTAPIRDRATTVAALHDFYDDEPGGPYLVFSPWPTPDLRDDGFLAVGHPPLMFRTPGPIAPERAAVTGSPTDSCRIERAGNAAQLEDFERVLIEAYPVSELQPHRPRTLLHPDALESAWQFFVAYDGDRAVATAGAFVTDRITMVELVSARPETRGRGIGAAVTAAATFAAPDQPALLISSDLGRGVYERLGYLPLLRYTLWIGIRA